MNQCIRAIGFLLEHMMREDSYRDRSSHYDFSRPRRRRHRRRQQGSQGQGQGQGSQSGAGGVPSTYKRGRGEAGARTGRAPGRCVFFCVGVLFCVDCFRGGKAGAADRSTDANYRHHNDQTGGGAGGRARGVTTGKKTTRRGPRAAVTPRTTRPGRMGPPSRWGGRGRGALGRRRRRL